MKLLQSFLASILVAQCYGSCFNVESLYVTLEHDGYGTFDCDLKNDYGGKLMSGVGDVGEIKLFSQCQMSSRFYVGVGHNNNWNWFYHDISPIPDTISISHLCGACTYRMDWFKPGEWVDCDQSNQCGGTNLMNLR
mmetsp:Transcript_1497/g.2205  ORF Transcript_1497/g.2205 Transcript_1497/m.2205 type:complete len:136 (+) Transcript_1497:95-502(+)